uniref:Uncharacterized protein n=1 Tax=Polytomella parva TaxID=51329 RepID=A0A7S0V1N6_9CHLO|mmetsp:Transcript_25726/g.46925  ORF Transcript_25726/g.46925 Transcript_25726/m.46925 type:complete len:510 (+) Transcript_25726:1103-2632(+)
MGRLEIGPGLSRRLAELRCWVEYRKRKGGIGGAVEGDGRDVKEGKDVKEEKEAKEETIPTKTTAPRGLGLGLGLGLGRKTTASVAVAVPSPSSPSPFPSSSANVGPESKTKELVALTEILDLISRLQKDPLVAAELPTDVAAKLCLLSDSICLVASQVHRRGGGGALGGTGGGQERKDVAIGTATTTTSTPSMYESVEMTPVYEKRLGDLTQWNDTVVRKTFIAALESRLQAISSADQKRSLSSPLSSSSSSSLSSLSSPKAFFAAATEPRRQSKKLINHLRLTAARMAVLVQRLVALELKEWPAAKAQFEKLDEMLKDQSLKIDLQVSSLLACKETGMSARELLKELHEAQMKLFLGDDAVAVAAAAAAAASVEMGEENEEEEEEGEGEGKDDEASAEGVRGGDQVSMQGKTKKMMVKDRDSKSRGGSSTNNSANANAGFLSSSPSPSPSPPPSPPSSPPLRQNIPFPKCLLLDEKMVRFNEGVSAEATGPGSSPLLQSSFVLLSAPS